MLPDSPRPKRGATGVVPVPQRARSVSSRLAQRADSVQEDEPFRKLERSATTHEPRSQRPLIGLPSNPAPGSKHYIPTLSRPIIVRKPVILPRWNRPEQYSTSFQTPESNSDAVNGTRANSSLSSPYTPEKTSSGSSMVMSSRSTVLERTKKLAENTISSQSCFEEKSAPKHDSGDVARLNASVDRNVPRNGWNKATTAASSVATNLNHTWASNVDADYPEAGGDPHLTKVTKAPYISKPDWLFSEKERGHAGYRSRDLKRDDPEMSGQMQEERSSQRSFPGTYLSQEKRGIRDAPSSNTQEPRTNGTSYPSQENGRVLSRVEMKLKERMANRYKESAPSSMDASKLPARTFVDIPHPDSEDYDEDVERIRLPPGPRVGGPRVGLPARPSPRRM